ncbi:MAG: T9SS type A sorting domain-containing protein, partial [Flavobacteriaceae bacterium]|nr:T9SS type A sorting domain-containing protein [Flavobacteriaceae bacterium]
MKILNLLFIVLICSFAQAQIAFEEKIVVDNSTVVNEPQEIFLADIDGDGDLDVVSASISYDDSKIAWHENIDGLGTYADQQIINSEIEEAIFVYAADIDGDGDMDVLSASMAFEGTKIAWYENLDGLGTFGSEQFITSELEDASVVKASDLDGDGDLDVVVSSTGFDNSLVAWFENLDGLGTFGGGLIISEDERIGSLEISDIDGDGDKDIITASFMDNSIKWFENLNGLGVFSIGTNIATGIEGGHVVKVGDVDNDGDLDIFSANLSEEKITWFENLDGLGNFGPQNVIISNFEYIIEINIYDIDNDGDLDVFAGSYTGNAYVSWFENMNGLGTFGSEQIVSDYIESITSIKFGDIDMDGDSDLFISSGDHRIAWFENEDGTGVFGEQNHILSSVVQPYSVISADIDGDGDLDILSASKADKKIAWYENLDGQGTIGVQRNISVFAFLATFVIAADIDGDGDMDVITDSGSTDTLTWFENIDGLGNFSSEKIVGTNSTKHLNVVDLDSDGDLDIVTVSDSSNKLGWFENLDGLGNFDSEQLINSIEGLTKVISSDIDGDNDMDLITSSFSSDMVTWHENLDGQGNFDAAQIVWDQSSNPTEVLSSDIDGDGDMDVISSNGTNIVWLENLNGLGSFGNQQIITTEVNNLQSIYVKDIDADGDQDVISASRFDNKIAWYENIDGLGNFGVQQIISTNALYAASVFAEDINGDGNMDVISSSIIDNKVAWYENLSLATNNINGVVRMDLDSNGCSPEDIPMPNLMIVSDNGVNTYSTFTLDNGVFQFFPPEEGNYTTTVSSELPTYYEASPLSHESNFVGQGNVDIADFCIEPIESINDLNISFYPLTEARPGFSSIYELIYRNVGTTILDGSIDLIFDDSKINFLAADETISSQTSNSISFDFEEFYPFETKTIRIYFDVFPPPTTENDDVLLFTASVNPIAGDYTPDDNVFRLEQIVVGSFDPNDIQVLEGEYLLYEDVDKYLHYIIRFQNTGTSHAIFVRITNELDPNLDWNTLQIENISHDNRIEIINGNEVTFIFDSIYLPDSTSDEEGSHGYIAYKIKPKNDVEIGDVFTNNANIFFDYNLPIATNTVTTTIVEDLSVSDNAIKNLRIFPNPTRGYINIQSNVSIVSVEVINQLGQMVVSKLNSEGIKSINIEQLQEGLYFIKLK